MWIGVLWAGLRVAMSITQVGGKLRHGLLEKSLTFFSCWLRVLQVGEFPINMISDWLWQSSADLSAVQSDSCWRRMYE